MNRILTLLLLSLSLCINAQQWRFWIDEKQPATHNILSNAKSVLLVNNAVVQPEGFGHTIAIDGETQESEQVDLTDAALYSLFAATQTLEYDPDILRVEILEHTQNQSNNFYSRKTLSSTQMQGICNRYAVDALLIINQLVLYNIRESFPLEDGSYYAYLQAYAQAHWTAYNHGKVLSFTTADTLVWESQPMYTRARALEQLPTTQEALLYLAQTTGDSIARLLTPQWIASARYLYDCSCEHMQAGLNSFRYQRWKEAIHHWQQIATDGALTHSKANKKAAAMAAANIAIAYEMLGDYSSACAYANEACHLFGAWKTAYGRQQQANIRYYLEQLQDKKEQVYAQ